MSKQRDNIMKTIVREANEVTDLIRQQWKIFKIFILNVNFLKPQLSVKLKI